MIMDDVMFLNYIHITFSHDDAHYVIHSYEIAESNFLLSH